MITSRPVLPGDKPFNFRNFLKAVFEKEYTIQSFSEVVCIPRRTIYSWRFQRPEDSTLRLISIALDKQESYFFETENKVLPVKKKHKKRKSKAKTSKAAADAEHYTEKMLKAAGLSSAAKAAVSDWIMYSDKRYDLHDSKKARADFKRLIDRFKSAVTNFCELAVCELVEECISKEYKSIAWGRLEEIHGHQDNGK